MTDAEKLAVTNLLSAIGRHRAVNQPATPKFGSMEMIHAGVTLKRDRAEADLNSAVSAVIKLIED